jgi:hypothetical protein
MVTPAGVAKAIYGPTASNGPRRQRIFREFPTKSVSPSEYQSPTCPGPQFPICPDVLTTRRSPSQLGRVASRNNRFALERQEPMNASRMSSQIHDNPRVARRLAAWNLCCGTLLVIAIVLFVAGRATAGIPVVMTQVGTPAFDVIDVNLFSPNFVPTAPYEVDLSILPKHGLFFDESIGYPAVGPQIPHGPPYDSELSDGVATASYKTGSTYNRVDFDRGVVLAFTQIPNDLSPFGATPDFPSGPALALDSYPYTVTDVLLFEGAQIVDFSTISLPYPATPDGFVDENGNPISFAGLHESHTHYVFGIFATLDIPDEFIVGQYVREISFLDAGGNGWEFSVPFQVVPEPGTLALLTCCLLVTLPHCRAGHRPLSAGKKCLEPRGKSGAEKCQKWNCEMVSRTSLAAD